MGHHLGASSLCLVSAHGADAKSRSDYLRIKGELEQDIRSIEFEGCDFFRPSLLLAHHEGRLSEGLAVTLIKPIDRRLNHKPFDSLWPIRPSVVARAMVGLSQQFSRGLSGVHCLSNATMHQEFSDD